MAEPHASSSETIWHGDGREQALQTHILNHPSASQLKGKPTAILAEIDQWATTNNHCMMTIGPERGQPILDLIRKSRPKTLVELGGYIGYSAIKFGDEVRRAGGSRYLSLEYNAEYAAVARALVEFAGLGEFVTIMVGPSSDSLARLGGEDKIDLLFLDHSEELYLDDLRLAEERQLLGPGSFVVADNVGSPRAADYVRWVEQKGGYESRALPYVLPNGQQDAVLITKKL